MNSVSLGISVAAPSQYIIGSTVFVAAETISMPPRSPLTRSTVNAGFRSSTRVWAAVSRGNSCHDTTRMTTISPTPVTPAHASGSVLRPICASHQLGYPPPPPHFRQDAGHLDHSGRTGGCWSGPAPAGAPGFGSPRCGAICLGTPGFGRLGLDAAGGRLSGGITVGALASHIIGIKLLIFHRSPSCLAVTTHRFSLSTRNLPSGDFDVNLVTTSTSTLPSSFHLSTPASSTVPVVGSLLATWTRTSFWSSRYCCANSPVA